MEGLNIAFAFTAGLVATVNPCGWAMLPSFVSYYLGSKEERYYQKPLTSRASEGIILGLLVTSGFLFVFAVTGFVVSAGMRMIVRWMPLAGIVTGLFLIFLGIWLWSGKSFGITIPVPNMNLNSHNPRSVFLFGIAYGLTSLSCTLPVFLAVVGAGLAADGPGVLLVMFLAYAAGMAAVLMAVAIGAALLKEGAVQLFRRFIPFVNLFSAGLLIVAGLYLIWYQGRYLPLILAGS